MPSFPQSGVEFVAEADQYLEAIDEMLSATEELSSGVSEVADEISSGFDSIEPPDFDFDFEAPDFDMGEFPEEVNTEVNIEPTAESEETVGLLKLIAGAAVFELILNIAGTAVEFFNSISAFTVAPILDVQDAVARFGAQTGEANDGIAELINQLHFVGDLGDFDDITNTLIAAEQQGIHFGEGMEEAATGALSISKVFEDASPVETLRTMNQLVNQGLVPDFQTASDLIAAGLQNGTNRAGDMFQTLNQFGPMFSEMEMNGQQVFSLLTSGLDAGFRSTQDVARAISTMNDNISNAAGDIESPVAQALDSIGVELPAAGETIGADFFNAVIEGISKNPDAADAAIADIFGTRAGKFSESLIDLTLVDQQFTDLENRAADAATEIDNSLRGALEDFILWIQSEISEFLSSSEIDLPGKLTELKERVQNLLSSLAKGEGLPIALEAALEAPGLAEDIRQLESAIGNFIIEAQLFLAGVLDLLQQSEAASDIRGNVADTAQTQLQFDVQTAEGADEIGAAIETAVSRGVEVAKIPEVLQDAMTEAMASSDFASAMDIAGFLDTIVNTEEVGSFAENLRNEMISEISAKMAEGDFESALDIAEALNEENLIIAVQEMAAAAGTEFDELATAAEDASDRVEDATNRHSIVPDIISVRTAAQTHIPPVNALFRMMEQVASVSLPATSSYVDALVNSIIEGMGNALPVVDAMIQKLAQLSEAATSARETVQSALNAGGGGGGSTTNNNVTVNQTNNVQSNAQAASVGQATSRGVRGMAA